MYLHKNPHGVYYYRRPIVAEDQAFWRGPSNTPKKEWSRSLRTKDRREAILRLADAADMYEAERAAQYARHAATASTGAAEESDRQREEREAAEAIEAARKARYEARRELRIAQRQRLELSTAELTPEEAAWRDLIRERERDLETLQQAVEGQQAVNAALAEEKGGPPPLRPSPRSVEALIEAYEADKSPRWSGSSKKAVAPVFRVLRDVFKGRAVESITRAEARKLVELLERLPTNIGKRRELMGLTVPEAVERGAQLGFPTIKPKTINDAYLLHIASMWNWAVREQWVVSSPFSGLSVHDPVDDADRRDPFTSEQLAELFSTGRWADPWQAGGEKPGAFWVPLLCLFHGLRNGEAAGLRVEDIGEEDGVPVLHVRPYDGKTIKTTGSRGTLPIHPELLAAGFLRYVEERRKGKHVLLFPEGTANRRGQIAAKLAERFSAYVKKRGFEGRKLGMHSFRHNFEDRLRAAEIPERTALALARRTEAGSSRSYGHGLSAKQKAEAIAKVLYPSLDLSHLTVSSK